VSSPSLAQFHDVSGADQLVGFTMSGTATMPDVRYFRFYPALEAEGVFFAARVLSGLAANVNVYAVRLADGESQDWPLWHEMAWSSARTPPRQSIAGTTRYRSVLVADEDYQHGYFAVAVVATGAVSVRLTTTDLVPIHAGRVQRFKLAGNAMRMFRYKGRATDSMFFAQLTAITGDPDLFVARRPWSRPPFYGTTDTDAQWTSAAIGSDSLTVWNTHPAFGSVWYVAVTSYETPSEFRVAVQSYELLEQGVPVTRLQDPSTYSYFLGSSLPPAAEQLSPAEMVSGRLATGACHAASATLRPCPSSFDNPPRAGAWHQRVTVRLGAVVLCAHPRHAGLHHLSGPAGGRTDAVLARRIQRP